MGGRLYQLHVWVREEDYRTLKQLAADDDEALDVWFAANCVRSFETGEPASSPPRPSLSRSRPRRCAADSLDVQPVH